MQVNRLLIQHGHPPNYDEETTYREICHLAVMPGIVATAIVDRFVYPDSMSLQDPWYDQECIGWVLRDVVVLEQPIPCKGSLGLWTVPAEIEAKITEG